MYWDLIILGLIIVIVVICFRKFSSFIYVVGTLDILLRLLTFLSLNLGVPEIIALIKRIGFPASIPTVIDRYTDGIVFTILMWVFFAIMVVFEFYVIRTFCRKKK